MLPDRIFSTFKTASQGLALQRKRLAVASRNIANANTSAPKGAQNIYRPQSVKSKAPEANNFKRVLRESVSSVTGLRTEGVATPGRLAAGQAPGEGLGPSFEVVEQDRFRYEYDPGHPDADENGMVRYPDIDLVHEMAAMVSANRLYEANLSSIEAEKQIIKRSLEI